MENVFENCNNRSGGGADYGAIHIAVFPTSPYFSRYNTISENKIYGHYHSGISAYGSHDANCYLSYLDIINNYIKSATCSVSNNHSMGIYLLQGANTNVKIIGNTIECNDAEGIIIASDTNYPGNKCIISNNIIRDCDFRGISLEIESSGGSYKDISITGNIIENTSSALHYSHQIWLDTITDSIISNNKCIGIKNGSSYIGAGIIFYNSCPRNQVNDNQVRTLSVGITFASPDGALKDNHVYDCDQGISLAYCKGSSIVGNIVNRCTTGISYGTSSAPLHIVANAILECTNRYSGTIAPEVMTLSGRADGGSTYSNFVVTGTLSSGAATVTFYHVYTGDRFLVLPANQSGSGAGAMYVSLIDVANSRVYVKSTDVNDARDFIIIKIVSGG